jgi:undecaprenyl-phosphate 4-deoxy-4-formamido-L-arabinose transferase
MTKSISIVVPVYGSEKILPELAKRIDEVMLERKINYELILVCDCSPDNSWEVIKELKKRNPKIQGILLRNNVGQHNALIAGLAASKNSVVVTMDDDLQHNPADIPALLDGIEEGHDVVYGQFQNRNHPAWKKAGSKFNNRVATIILGKPKNLYLSPFRAISREIVDEILKFRGPFVYVDGLIVIATKSINSVLIEHHERHEGKSLYGISKSIKLWLQMATTTSITPLRLTTLLGLGLSLFSLLMGILLIIQKFTIDAMPIGWSSLIVTILFVSGVQLFSLGMIGEYLGKTSLVTSGRSQYVVKETIA